MSGLYQKLAKTIDRTLKRECGPNTGFCLLVFGFHQPGISNYVSNADRADMIKALRETADRLERGQDNPTKGEH